jgi:hypothetical protein
MKRHFRRFTLNYITVLVLIVVVTASFFWQQSKSNNLNTHASELGGISNLSTYKKHRAEFKDAPDPANNSEFSLLDIPKGSGIVNYIWLADRPNGNDYPEFDNSIRVYTNGSSIPNINTDLGMFFGYANADAFTNPENISTTHWTARYGGASHLDRTGGTFSLPIPFQNGIRIVVANTNNSPSYIFSQIDYTLVSDNSGLSVPPYTLNIVGNKWVGDRKTANAADSVTLATIPAGNPGVIVGQSMAGGGAKDYSYLERQMALYIDGEGMSSIKSSGTEDWFGASDYFFTGQSPYSSPAGMGLGAANDTANSFSALTDFLALDGGYAFNSSATLVWLHNSATDTSNTYSSALWYYRHL